MLQILRMFENFVQDMKTRIKKYLKNLPLIEKYYFFLLLLLCNFTIHMHILFFKEVTEIFFILSFNSAYIFQIIVITKTFFACTCSKKNVIASTNTITIDNDRNEEHTFSKPLKNWLTLYFYTFFHRNKCMFKKTVSFQNRLFI